MSVFATFDDFASCFPPPPPSSSLLVPPHFNESSPTPPACMTSCCNEANVIVLHVDTRRQCHRITHLITYLITPFVDWYVVLPCTSCRTQCHVEVTRSRRLFYCSTWYNTQSILNSIDRHSAHCCDHSHNCKAIPFKDILDIVSQGHA